MQIASPAAAAPTPHIGFSFSRPAAPSAAEQAFLDYAKETAAQKMRDAILNAMGLTEAKLQAMDPKERGKVEEKIREIIKEKVEQSTERKTGQIVDLKA